MKKIYVFVFSIFLFFAQAQEFNISLNLEKGKSYEIKSTSFNFAKHNVNGQLAKINMHLLTTLVFKVLHFQDDIYELEGRYVYYQNQILIMNNFNEFSSDYTTTPFDLGLKKMLNIPFFVQISKSGKIINIREYEKVTDAILSEFPEENREALKQELDEKISENSLKNLLNSTMVFLPKKKVKIGESWIIEDLQPSGLDDVFEKKYTLDKVDENFYYISASGTANSTPEKTVVLNGITFSPHLKFIENSTFKIHKKTGWINIAQINTKYTGTMKNTEVSLDTDSVLKREIQDTASVTASEKERRIGVNAPEMADGQ